MSDQPKQAAGDGAGGSAGGRGRRRGRGGREGRGPQKNVPPTQEGEQAGRRGAVGTRRDGPRGKGPQGGSRQDRRNRNTVEFHAGATFGRWSLDTGGSLGRDVWAVRDLDGGELGVIKRARPGGVASKRFRHEIDVLALLGLPDQVAGSGGADTAEPVDDTRGGVLRLLDRDHSETPQWMVTERAVLLGEHLGPAPDLFNVVVSIAQIAKTLISAKVIGIAHRDLKPDNMFFVRGRTVLGDFGLATGPTAVDLTQDGTKVGPANFNAPETSEWQPGKTDPFAADVYALAKTMWVLATGTETYPPPGPLLIRHHESDLTRFVGRSAESLGRLLELSTGHSPHYRPSIEVFNAELDQWLEQYPQGTPRPSSRSARFSFNNPFSAAQIERSGPTKVLERSLRLLLDEFRSVGPNNGRVQAHPPRTRHELWDDLAGGDPSWAPDEIITRRLWWEGVQGVRLIATAVLEGEDEVTFEVRWETREPGQVGWTSTWVGRRTAQMRMPSEVTRRRELRDMAVAEIPGGQLLVVAPDIPDGTVNRLRGLARRSSRHTGARDEEWSELRARIDARNESADAAIAQLNDIWDELVRSTDGVLANEFVVVTTAADAHTRYLELEPFRLSLTAFEAPTHLSPAVLLGTVTVRCYPDAAADEGELERHVANVAAMHDPTGPPSWELIVVTPPGNTDSDDSTRSSEVGNSGDPSGYRGHARHGALGIDALDRLLRDHVTAESDADPACADDLVDRSPLTSALLLDLFITHAGALSGWR